jgi:undecaprenyl-diphosphatase
MRILNNLFSDFVMMIYQTDLVLLRSINVTHSSPMMDRFWLFITHMDRNIWVMYLIVPILIASLFYIYKWKAFRPLVMLALAVGLADALAYRGIKTFIQRPRPFQNTEISSWVRKVGDAHGPSFPSNHAANCFAGAAILAWYFSRSSKYFYSFAVLVAISRVALGVHYPSDVVGGMMLGLFVGFLIRKFVLTRFKFLRIRKPVPKPDFNFNDWRTRSRRLTQH